MSKIRAFSIPRPEFYPDAPIAAGCDTPAYREAMSRVAGAVHLIATDGKAGRAGLTATAFTSVSDRPPMVLVCLNRASRTMALLRENGHFSVNTLASGQQELADVFAGRTGAHGHERFGHGVWQDGVAGQPVLAGALLHFVVRLVDIRAVATHDVVIGEVLDIGLGTAQTGLVYTRRAYHAV